MFLRLRHLIEYMGLRLALAVFDRLRLPTAEVFVSRMAGLWYFLHVSRRRIAKANVRRSGIAGDDSREISRIARASFRHFAVLIIESLKSGHVFNEDNWRDRVETHISSSTMSLLNDPGQGLILVSGHLGNWEIAAQLLSYIKPVVGITRDMNNPYTDRLMKERKPRNRFHLTPKHDTNIARFLSILKNGEILALMIDQHAGDRGMMVPFFGTPASTYTSPALLHLITGAPLCFVYCLRTGPMTYTLNILDPVFHRPTGNKERDISMILNTFNRELESAIRESPEQYLWAHRRWRGISL